MTLLFALEIKFRKLLKKTLSRHLNIQARLIKTHLSNQDYSFKSLS